MKSKFSFAVVAMAAVVAVMISLSVGAGLAAAAAGITVDSTYNLSDDGKQFAIKLSCETNASGAVPSTTIDAINGLSYWKMGFWIVDIYALNPATGFPSAAGTIVISDVTGHQIVGPNNNNPTLTLATTASAESKVQGLDSIVKMSVADKLVISATGAGASKTFTVFLIMAR